MPLSSEIRLVLPAPPPFKGRRIELPPRPEHVLSEETAARLFRVQLAERRVAKVPGAQWTLVVAICFGLIMIIGGVIAAQ